MLQPSHPLRILADGLGSDGLATLMGHLQRRAVSPGQVLVACDDRSDTLFVIEDGSLDVELVAGGETVCVATVGPGEWVGEVALLDPGPASATVRTATPSVVLALDHRALIELRRDDPAAAQILLRNLSRSLAHRLRVDARLIVSWDGSQAQLVEPARGSWVMRVLGGLLGWEDLA